MIDEDRSMKIVEITTPYKPRYPVYLRIGDWNLKDPISYNYAMGTRERGLSVYALDASGNPIVPDRSEWADVDLNDRLRSNDPKFLVQGRRVGTGHDGEPLLVNVRVVGEWKPR
jgi:hypothetical protein